MECGDSRAANGSNMPLQTQQRTLVAIPHYNYGSRPSHSKLRFYLLKPQFGVDKHHARSKMAATE
uniref:Uncharacterized protein n=1 Tax=Strigamia maritima TaxID=126957 RepID=T1JJQ0_STRMM